MKEKKYRNPILSGMYPDPSITRAGDDYYLVNSTFQFFPGVPVFHSTNLANWEQIGHCLERDSQLDLMDANPAFGIYAPTIRYHEGTFYMITTNMSTMIRDMPGNFIVTAQNPEGPWSEPIWIDHGGIDPDIFFDEDGKVYFCGTGDDEQGFGIMVFEINPTTGKILSDKVMISRGCGNKCPEGPHLYKKDGWYYLQMAEGGTEYGHMITMQRSKSLYGPYEQCPWNPIMSHRSFDSEQIQCLGHGDMLEDANGNWWMVCLGVRQCGAMLHNLGRETFLFPITWKDGWPKAVSPKVSEWMTGPLPGGEVQPLDENLTTDFTDKELGMEWNYIQNPIRTNYQLTGQELRLTGEEYGLSDEKKSPTFVGVRQKELDAQATTTVKLDMEEGTIAGLSVYYMATHHYEIQVRKQNGGYLVELSKQVYDMKSVSEALEVTGDTVKLKIQASGWDYIFSCVDAQGNEVEIGRGRTAGLATEGMEFMTFTGTYFGVFAQNGSARFTSFARNIEL